MVFHVARRAVGDRPPEEARDDVERPVDPAETPAVVTNRSLSMKRRPAWTVESGAAFFRFSRAPYHVVIAFPSTRGVFARANAPVQTVSVTSASPTAFWIQAMASRLPVRRPELPPGMTTMSARGASAKENSGVIVTTPWLFRGSFVRATVKTRKARAPSTSPNPDADWKTSVGPAKSRISTPS